MNSRTCFIHVTISVVFVLALACSGIFDDDTDRDAGSDAEDVGQDAKIDADDINQDAGMDAHDIGQDSGADADTDADTDDSEVGLAKLSLSKIVVGTFPNGSENLQVNAQDEQGDTDTWRAMSLDESIATVSKAGSQLTVMGENIGDTSVVITSGAGLEREIEVRV